MANLSDTLITLNKVKDIDGLERNSVCLITTNGVYFGTQTFVNDEDKETKNIEDITKTFYYYSIKQSEKVIEETSIQRDLDETILLENVKFKIGNVIFNTKHVILNISQIVGLMLVPNDQVDEYLNQL